MVMYQCNFSDGSYFIFNDEDEIVSGQELYDELSEDDKKYIQSDYNYLVLACHKCIIDSFTSWVAETSAEIPDYLISRS